MISENTGKPAGQPLYLQIADKAEGIIRSRGLRPHEPAPSEAELARLFGVSRMTAKLALDQLADRNRVYRLARRGTFVAEVLEKDAEAGLALHRPASEVRIGFVVSNLDYYTSAIMSSLEYEARRTGFKLELKLSRDIADEDACLEQLAAAGADGILLFPRGRDRESAVVRKLKSAGYPLVAIDRAIPGLSSDCVLHDHFQGAYEMVRSFILAGHTEIGFVTNPLTGISSIEERYRGYMKALVDHGIGLQSQYIHIIGKTNALTDYTQRNATLDQFLQEQPQLTAVMCGDDYLAASVMYAALRIGRSVPDQLSVAGFSDSQLATMLPVPLTTVGQPTGELARSAAELLMKRIANGAGEPFTIKIKTRIVERKSVRTVSSI